MKDMVYGLGRGRGRGLTRLGRGILKGPLCRGPSAGEAIRGHLFEEGRR